MTTKFRTVLARLEALRTGNRGTFAIEHALVMPFLLLLLSGAIDLGYALNQSSSLSGAARVGAQYAMRFPSDADGIKDVVNMAKLLASEASWFAADTCVQTFGGYGFAEEYDVERKFRETRLYQVAPISTNLILSHVATHVLGMPRSF
jgi:alkylation response protein AidB-like acyl-CoA dehydrogenase